VKEDVLLNEEVGEGRASAEIDGRDFVNVSRQVPTRISVDIDIIAFKT